MKKIRWTRKEVACEGCIHLEDMPRVAKIWSVTYINPFFTDGLITDFTFSIREYIVDCLYHKGFIANTVGYSVYQSDSNSVKDFFQVTARGGNGKILFEYRAEKEQMLFTSYEYAKKFHDDAIAGLREYISEWHNHSINTLNGIISNNNGKG